MKYHLLILLSLATACHSGTEQVAAPIGGTGTLVTVTHIKQGAVNDNITIFGTTLYLKRNLVTASIASFITKVNIHLGDRVHKGEILYILESKEHRALGQGTPLPDTSLNGFGLVIVKAPADGVVTTFDKQQVGDYVLEGAQLCTIAESNDLAFQLNVPYEYTSFIRQGSDCRIILPDSTIHDARVTAPLTNMNMSAQTQSVLAKSKQPLFLPENLIVKVLISKHSNSNGQVLPRSCVQSDEMMQQYWVMKLVNDSTAIKIPVQTGNSNQEEISILSPAFSATDRILLTGAYGLNDTATVKLQ
ncbi:efflux RND transporter periplasmic adaptor subunit [Chitinophaga sancti]|uniref:efflux RND transporter periplasmic adaptor subunit n=1 Tax=Chitinophaga sancti TaxID=1004 RepID=UPI003F79F207